ncbi:class I SAM-dependent methyltransferase [Paenibacillus glycanilyticus]|uniref:Methyltransferase n=1 Tax=Paenibacillus glycanilyticus TaxID=126569 RepID=A0ABQ6G9E4_9BACL|nr:class I SAM-dependent methyltransferase [Paenibacillus glycanilyticus]GLX66670.1 methyltransferase [Paenibacillus glycanilyticus]
MADKIFEEPRLAELYDWFDTPDRPDLDHYASMATEFQAHSIIDLGCGTGNLACRLASMGKEVIGIDPAMASLNVAKGKDYGTRVKWLHGTIDAIQGMQVDLVTMTGNVAQVFITDEEWTGMLRACQEAIRPGGRLVFEVRDPAMEAWNNWNRESTYQCLERSDFGRVETWVDLLEVNLPWVTFRHTFIFCREGKELTSDSTLRFRSKEEIMDALSEARFVVEEIRDAPDRPGLEFVFIARRAISE